MVERNGLYFERIAGDCIRVTLGKPESSESERILDINEFWLPALIAGLKAIKETNRG